MLNSPTIRHKKTILFTAAVIAGAIGLLVMEGVCRELDSLKSSTAPMPVLASLFNKSLNLDPYEVASDRFFGHWTLRPGYQATSQRVADEKLAQAKSLGAEAFKPDLTARPSNPDAFRGIQINKSGFRGEEAPTGSGGVTITAIGDSVTFGLGEVSYPDELAFTLKQRSTGISVVNAGVEGYQIRNHMIEFNRYRFPGPGIALIYLGWNDLYLIDVGAFPGARSSSLLMNLTKVFRIFTKPRFAEDWEMKQSWRTGLPKTSLPPDIENGLDEIFLAYGELVKKLKDSGSRIFVMTLPTLLNPGEVVNDLILKRAHIPHYASSVPEFASTVFRFNSKLREYAGQWGAGVIDLDRWAAKTLQPRENYFLDTVHVSAAALRMISVKIASDLNESGALR